jgi:hypothetical protein
MSRTTIFFALTISIVFSGLLIISVQTGAPKSLWNTQRQQEGRIHNPQYINDETISIQQEKLTNPLHQKEINEDENSNLEISAAIPTHLLGLVRQYLAEQLGVEPQSIEVVAMEEVIWPDRCLGLPAPELCAQEETPGYRITFRVLGQEYIYRTNKEEGFRFEGPGDEPRRP